MLAISGCQTGPQTGKVGGATEFDTNLTLQEEDVLQAFALEDEESWLEAAEAYQVLAEKYSQPDKSSFHIKTALMYYKAESHRMVETYFQSLPEGAVLEQDKNHQATIIAGCPKSAK